VTTAQKTDLVWPRGRQRFPPLAEDLDSGGDGATRGHVEGLDGAREDRWRGVVVTVNSYGETQFMPVILVIGRLSLQWSHVPQPPWIQVALTRSPTLREVTPRADFDDLTGGLVPDDRRIGRRIWERAGGEPDIIATRTARVHANEHFTRPGHGRGNLAQLPGPTDPGTHRCQDHWAPAQLDRQVERVPRQSPAKWARIRCRHSS
jgi:hypothetical protein